MAVRPSTNFPGRAHENVLTQLLRKKLEPDVEELVAQGRETARLATPEGIAELQDIWDELRLWTLGRHGPDGKLEVGGRIAEYVVEEAAEVYTKEERDLGTENVRTGLKRDLEEDDYEDEDEDDDEEDEGEGGESTNMEKKQTENKAKENGDSGKGEHKRPPRGPEPETLLWFAARGDFEVPRNVEFERKIDVYRGLQGVNMPPEPMQGVSIPDEPMQGVNPSSS